MKVYHARWITEDTNPWDSNESYGVWGNLEDAQKSAFVRFHDLEEDAETWVETDTTYTGYGSVRTWKRVSVEPGEEPEDDGEGYGMYIFEEELR